MKTIQLTLHIFLIVHFTSCIVNAYGNYDGLEYAERIRCVNVSTPCRIEKDHVNVFVVGDTGGMSLDLTNDVGHYYATHTQTRMAVDMAHLAETSSPDFFIDLGDLIYWNGPDYVNDTRFNTLFEEPFQDARLMKPWFMIGGNHDHLGNIDAEIEYSKRKGKWTFPSLYYKTSYAFNGGKTTVDFLFIDTIIMCGNSVDPDSRSIGLWIYSTLMHKKDLAGPQSKYANYDRTQWAWLNKQLSESTADYIFVSGHYPIHSISSHGPTKCLFNRLDPLMRRYNVSAYMAGHDHNLQFYRRNVTSTTMHYIVSGVGSRIDPSEQHLSDENSEGILYRYPYFADLGWWRRVARTYLLGRGWGGFVRLRVGIEETRVEFYADENAQLKFSASIAPRGRPQRMQCMNSSFC